MLSLILGQFFNYSFVCEDDVHLLSLSPDLPDVSRETALDTVPRRGGTVLLSNFSFLHPSILSSLLFTAHSSLLSPSSHSSPLVLSNSLVTCHVF